jgi:hypothetical protein
MRSQDKIFLHPGLSVHLDPRMGFIERCSPPITPVTDRAPKFPEGKFLAPRMGFLKASLIEMTGGAPIHMFATLQ